MQTDNRFKELTINQDGQLILQKAKNESIETVWDRYEKQSRHCVFCEVGLSCRICMMGPCRINPKEPEGKKGVCGADADIIVARNFLRMVASGAASHSDHGRDLIEVLRAIGEGKTKEYSIKSPEKLLKLAQEYELDIAGKDLREIALSLAYEMEEEFGTRLNSIRMIGRAPKERLEIWKKYDVIPRGIDRETTESLHRTHMGVDNDWTSLLLHASRNALADGWGGSMIGTELSDVIFGIPTPRDSSVNLGVLKEDEVNIILHGHNPLVSDMISDATRHPDMLSLSEEVGAKGINLCGVCCTGNEILMRKGIPMAANHLMTELTIITGAVEALVVDYQCIMPSLGIISKCYHTKMFSTSSKAKFPEAEHVEITPQNAFEKSRYIVETAIKNFRNRNMEKVLIPVKPLNQKTGYSVEAILEILGGSPKPLVDSILDGKIRGIVGLVGCNNPRVKQDNSHMIITRNLIANDIMVVDTGCASVATAKGGLKSNDAKESAGKGLREICEKLNIPPVLHFGSCVDNSRILAFASIVANYIGKDISALPIAASAPEWYSEKAVTIALYAVVSGITTFLGVMPPINGSKKITELATNGLKDIFGAHFVVESNPELSSKLIIDYIESKRKILGI